MISGFLDVPLSPKANLVYLWRPQDTLKNPRKIQIIFEKRLTLVLDLHIPLLRPASPLKIVVGCTLQPSYFHFPKKGKSSLFVILAQMKLPGIPKNLPCGVADAHRVFVFQKNTYALIPPSFKVFKTSENLKTPWKR